jgi:NAD(P)-dependent dehydrogenase (short-subunit alcohol dehydrogenase family)
MAIPAESKVALIIGAGTALGAEIARGLASSGMQLALNDQLPTRIEPLAAEITAGGGNATAFAADVSRKLSLQTMLQDVLEKYARIDLLVFIASVQPPDLILDMDEWDWHRTIDLNLTAAFLCMQSVGRVMRDIGGGVIVNVINVPVTTSNVKRDSAAYAVATAGVEALSRKAHKEFAAHEIRVLVARSAEEALQILNAA